MTSCILRSSVVLVMFVLVPTSLAGPGYLACYYGCLGVCFTGGTAAASVCPPAGLYGAAACTSGCAALCAPSLVACFSEDTRVLGWNSSMQSMEALPLSSVQVGQKLWSFQGGYLPVKVIENRRLEGNFSFVELDVMSQNRKFSLAVTEEHNMPRIRKGSAKKVEEQHLEVVLAKELRVGDMLAASTASDESGVASGVIFAVRRVDKSVKHVLTTDSGSILANNILSSTICDGREEVYDRSSWLKTLVQWKGMHHEFFSM
mmetsp:Transcript_50245/g.82785  ORF Transcript_50245/g.82785 Transcript_50245/m.82785 type:complete len:260 (+) Transcript_50245:70-849(+)